MNRRRFLLLGSSGLAAAALPEMLGCSDPGPIVPEQLPPPSADVAAALARARAIGKPLLILVVPKERKYASSRGDLYACLLDSESDETMADLALCEVICAGVDDVARALPEASTAVQVAFVLVPTGGATSRIRTETFPLRHPSLGLPTEEQVRAAGEVAAVKLHRLIAPDASAIATLAETNRSTLDAARRRAVEDASREPARCDAALADRAAPFLLDRSLELGTRNAACVTLADAARARLREVSPPGARWARDRGCGIEFEGERAGYAVCGTGNVSNSVKRFLHFYAQ